MTDILIAFQISSLDDILQFHYPKNKTHLYIACLRPQINFDTSQYASIYFTPEENDESAFIKDATQLAFEKKMNFLYIASHYHMYPHVISDLVSNNMHVYPYHSSSKEEYKLNNDMYDIYKLIGYTCLDEFSIRPSGSFYRPYDSNIDIIYFDNTKVYGSIL